ncbi:lipoprotein [Rhodococcus wratislaviensis IFP 2016]|nr:lipoprotein [Rhodococcus wratislaviensis IFP 2016]
MEPASRQPPTCRWNTKGPEGDTDLTFTFSAHDSLQQLWRQARRGGLETERLVVTKEVLDTTITATGFYARNPRDPGVCAVLG